MRIVDWLRAVFNRQGSEATETIRPYNSPTEKRRDPSDPIERKLHNENRIKALGLPVNPHLPVIETADEAAIQMPELVYHRFSALMVSALKADGLHYGNPSDEVNRHIQSTIEDRQMLPWLSPSERVFIEDPNPSREKIAHFIWGYDAAYPLLWALGLTQPQLESPHNSVDLDEIVGAFKTLHQAEALSLLTPDVILDEADLVYRQHWALRQIDLERREDRSGLSLDIVMERHKALNWLIGYGNLEWDDVTTDT